jgi:LysM repeat protein
VLLAATLALTLSGNVQTWWYHIQDLQLREQEAALETAALEYRVEVECDPGDQSYLTEWVEVKNVGLGHAEGVYILFKDTGVEVLDAGSEFPRDEVQIHVSETALQVETSPFMLNAGASYRLRMRLANYGSTDTGRVWQIFGIQQNNLEVTTASSVSRSAPYGYLEDLVGFPEVRTHQVGESESLEDVAEAYGLSIDSLINYNPLIAHRRPRPLQPGEILVVQPSACGQARAALTAPRDVWYPIGTHIVRSGENLFCIARAYGVEPWAIVDYNVLGGPNSVETGQEVVVPNVYGSLPPGRTCPPQFEMPAPGFWPYPSPPGCRYSHTVVAGENLYRISLRYGVSMYAIAQGNGITDFDSTLEGQILCIP